MTEDEAKAIVKAVIKAEKADRESVKEPPSVEGILWRLLMELDQRGLLRLERGG